MHDDSRTNFCWNCAHFKDYDSTDEDGQGECRRYAPRAKNEVRRQKARTEFQRSNDMKFGPHYENEQCTHFPLMHSVDWCGEHVFVPGREEPTL